MNLAFANSHLDGCTLRRGSVLDPVPELLKEAGRLAARTTKAMRQTGGLEVSVKVPYLWDDFRHCLVVVLGAAGGDDVVGLLRYVLAGCNHITQCFSVEMM